jgi:hypothetical protein
VPSARAPLCLSLLSALALAFGASACAERRPGGGGDDDDAGDDASPADDESPADDDSPSDDDSPADDDETAGDDDDDSTPPDPWVADAALYAHTADQLFVVDPQPPYGLSPVATFHDSAGGDVPSFTDLAVDLWGAMYACSTHGLWQVAPGTGEAVQVFDTSGEFFVALTFLADGTLLLGGDEFLFVVDLSGPSYTPVATFDGFSWDGDMVGLPDGLLYAAMRADGEEDADLVVYDYGGAEIVDSGSTGTNALFGLGYGEGTLFGFTDGGTIVEIDPSSGAATVLAETGEPFYGAATNPVRWPE